MARPTHIQLKRAALLPTVITLTIKDTQGIVKNGTLRLDGEFRALRFFVCRVFVVFFSIEKVLSAANFETRITQCFMSPNKLKHELHNAS